MNAANTKLQDWPIGKRQTYTFFDIDFCTICVHITRLVAMAGMETTFIDDRINDENFPK